MKTYRIRDKRTGKFVAFGYNQKSRWTNRPSYHLENLKAGPDAHHFELVTFQLVETEVEQCA